MLRLRVKNFRVGEVGELEATELFFVAFGEFVIVILRDIVIAVGG